MSDLTGCAPTAFSVRIKGIRTENTGKVKNKADAIEVE